MTEKNTRFALAISGEGTIANSLLNAQGEGEFSGVEIVAVVASNARAGGKIEKKNLKVLKHGQIDIINPYHFKTKGENDRNKYGAAWNTYVDELKIDGLFLAGQIPVIDSSTVKKVKIAVNSHPGTLDPGRLDPEDPTRNIDYGGEGMRGVAPTVARLAYSWATGEDYWTESTIHFITPDGELDKGLLVSSATLDTSWATPSVLGWRSPMSIAKIRAEYRNPLVNASMDVYEDLKALERKNAVETLKKFGFGNIPVGYVREKSLIPDVHIPVYREAKKLAFELTEKGKFKWQ